MKSRYEQAWGNIEALRLGVFIACILVLWLSSGIVTYQSIGGLAGMLMGVLAPPFVVFLIWLLNRRG
jgi:hypothetical protein